MPVSRRYNRGRYTIDLYEFQHGGDGDVKLCDFVGDSRQGFRVPAQSMMIHNHGGGAGDNYIYYATIHDSFGTSAFTTLKPDAFHNYFLGESTIYGVLVYASNANCRFSLLATPGEWQERDVEEFITMPSHVKRTMENMYSMMNTGPIVL